LPGFLRKRRAWDEAVDARAMERWLARTCAAWEPDLLYERWSLFACLGKRLSRQLGVPWFLEVNAPLAWEACWFEGLKPSRALLRREAATLCAADRVLVVSEQLRDYVLRRGVLPERVDVVPNGANAPRSVAESSPQLVSSPFVVGYEGTFKSWHGMTEALPRLHALVVALAPRPLRLELWGDGPHRQEFQRQLQLELPNVEVDFRGWGEPERSHWDAAWIPLADWPPPSESIARIFGEDPPDRYFSPLKEAAARAAGIGCWYGDERGVVSSPEPPQSWAGIAAGVLGRASLTACLPSRESNSWAEQTSSRARGVG